MFGIAGMLISVPVAVVLKMFISDFLQGKKAQRNIIQEEQHNKPDNNNQNSEEEEEQK